MQKMQEMEQELIAVTKERDACRVEAANWRAKYDVVNGEKLEFLRQVRRRRGRVHREPDTYLWWWCVLFGLGG